MKRIFRSLIVVASLALCTAETVKADLVTELRGYFQFDNGFTNSVIGGVNGTGTNGASSAIAGGIVGNAMELRRVGGGNQHMNVGIGYGAATATFANLGRNFTISAWYNLDNPPSGSTSDRYFVYEGNNTYDASYGIRNLSVGVAGINDGQFFTEAVISGAPNRNVEDAALNGLNGWRHVAQTFSSNGTNTLISNFIDGSLNSTFTSLTSGVVDVGLNFGAARTPVTDRGFDGKIDEVALWSKSLSAAEIEQVFDRGVAGISLTAIPEPSSAVILAGIGCVLGVARRRRSK